MLLALFCRWPRQFRDFGHFKPDFFLDNLEQCDIGRAQVTGGFHQRPAQGARAGIELPHSARNQVNQNVGVANFLQGLSCQFRVQCVV